ncbi:alpha/beta fold hydrolase [Pseudohongiella sp. SYSU M77423]|uniref:alpha/beta hydrolase family protein n=1 Tax=Pseudohongiella sp. SYSU M77423 TaxID=3042312 RepID=UPI00248080F9|nr:alpha/beta fold hydrolase [Pseudohongiella sp. SYSU M77423]MDH7945051.1 alpha/beta fold hydrolase [Pseudohongiella sp. SYSU M77423]MEC8858848.1 alpha/beta fold hydrolase [Pseudomonadota bacterium]
MKQSAARTLIAGCILVLVGSLLAHWVQTSGGTRIEDVRFTGDNGQTLSALLYIPANASADSPAPGVLAVHGYINSREVQSGFAIELARRGYVVLALDQSGHGYSDAPAFSNGFGGPAALRYLRSLDIVDPDNIGLEGHSMGGWTVLAAAAAMPDAYRSMVLQGSSTGSGRALPGTPDWPRNVSVVFAQYDEFAPLMWEVPRGSDVADSEKLQAMFGVDDAIQEGRVYGSVPAGTARVLHNPPVTHPGNHLSHASIGHTVDWFALTLSGAQTAGVTGQIWFFKEIGTLLAFVGFVVLLCGAIKQFIQFPTFAGLSGAPINTAWTQRNGKWWLLAALSMFIPVAVFYPVFSMAASMLPASSWFPQSITNQIIVWAVVNGLLATALGLVIKAEAVSFKSLSWFAAARFALAIVGVGYLALLLADYFFLIDFRFWFVGLKLLSLDQFQNMLIYLPPLLVFFLLLGRALHGGLSVSSDTVRQQYLSNAMVLAGGFAIFLLAQYISLFTRGLLLTPAEPLNTIVMIQFVPLLVIISTISTCAWRHTGSYVPGALINTMFVGWYIVAGQATQAV